MKRRALVVGLGIAGMASAISLARNGWEPVIIERAKQRRTGGYFIGLQASGREAAEKLGVMAGIHVRTPARSSNWHLTRDGSRIKVAGFADQPARPATMLRGDIEQGLWQAVGKGIEVRFATTLLAIADEGDRVRVRMREGTGAEHEEVFDLLIGADGLRSTVRRQVFGPDDRFMHSHGAIICAFQLENQMETFRNRDGIIVNADSRSLWIFPFEDHAPTALFAYRTDDVDAQFSRPPVDVLREVFAGIDGSGIIDETLDDLTRANHVLFDSVQEVRMDAFTKGRVVLVGDSAWCLTLFSGMGATSAIVGGQHLGDALGRHGDDIGAALAEWEAGMRAFTGRERKTVYLKSQLFVPSNPFFFVLRRIVLRRGGRFLAKLATPSPTS